jgi:predicted GNAT family acetyltransferase
VQVHSGHDAKRFLADAAALLASDPFSTSVIATTARRSATAREPDHEHDLWLTVTDAHGLAGVAMQTPPRNLFLSRMPQTAARLVADALHAAGRELPGVTGPSEAASAFAERWCELSGVGLRQSALMRMYRLHALEPPTAVAGDATLAKGPADLALVERWLAAFHSEAIPQDPPGEWRELARRRIAAGEVHLWRVPRGDGEAEPVALAARSAPAAGVARVGPVYTPPAHRRHGYGAAVTAATSAAALAAGAEHVVLYADLANPTSNSIYQAIGFRPDHDAQQLAFIA